MQLLIRPALAADVTKVVQLVADTLGEFGLQFGVGSPTDDELHHLPGSYESRRGAFWVAERDGALLGTCGVVELDTGTFELRKMYLLPAARGLGLGAQLLERVVDHVRALGGARIVLDTVESMQSAIAFYERNGFVRDDSWIRGTRCTRAYVRTL